MNFDPYFKYFITKKLKTFNYSLKVIEKSINVNIQTGLSINLLKHQLQWSGAWFSFQFQSDVNDSPTSEIFRIDIFSFIPPISLLWKVGGSVFYFIAAYNWFVYVRNGRERPELEIG